MDDAEAQKLLSQLDDPSYGEYPDGFDYRTAEARARSLLPSLEALFATPVDFEDGAKIQDAAFHTDVFIPESALTRPLGTATRAVLRFSNFGNMVAVWPEDAIAPDVLRRMQQVLEGAGYRWIPARVLNRPYHPARPKGLAIDSWWDRFFEWF
jgi:hypothetical protein